MVTHLQYLSVPTVEYLAHLHILLSTVRTLVVHFQERDCRDVVGNYLVPGGYLFSFMLMLFLDFYIISQYIRRVQREKRVRKKVDPAERTCYSM